MSKLNDETRTRLLIDMELDTDPTGSTVELKVDGTWYPATWLETPTGGGEVWRQTSRTETFFAGPAVDAPPAETVVLELGRHLLETRVTFTDGDTVTKTAGFIDVVTR